MKEQYGFETSNIEEFPGIMRCFENRKLGFAVAEVTEVIYRQNRNGLVEEAGIKQEVFERFRKQTNCHFLLLVWKEQEEDRLYFFSDTKRVRAIEFMDYMISEFGLVTGDAQVAAGRISSTILKVQMSGMDMEDAMDYYLDRISSYFTMTQIVDAKEYGTRQQEAIRKLPRYRKKKIPWAFVKSTDITKEGETFRIRSLENESGIVLTAQPDLYIMIGCRGEAYDINRHKFERTYEVTGEVLDIFEQMLDFIPEAELIADGSYVSLDELAHLCYPRQGNAIYAVMLDERTKVFPTNGEEEYYLGRPGDYMAVREEDLTDIYIIQGDIFAQTYEEKVIQTHDNMTGTAL